MRVKERGGKEERSAEEEGKMKQKGEKRAKEDRHGGTHLIPTTGRQKQADLCEF